MQPGGDWISIDRRFRGPPGSGNGGYVCGLVARRFESPVEVRLKKPPPLERPIEIVAAGDGVRLTDGESVIAEGRPCTLALDVPACPDRGAISAAAARYPGLRRHAFPGCFVCGAGRKPGDGLRVFPGALDNRPELVAAPWCPDPSLADVGGLVRPEFLWAALDCPGYWAVFDGGTAAVLGRLQAAILRPLRAGDTAAVVAWTLGGSGRKYEAASAIYDSGGRPVAKAKAVWITVDPAAFGAI